MMALLWFVAAAFALPNQYCFEYTLAFTDGATGDFLTGTETKARGAKVRFIDESSGAVTAVFLDWDGADPGCKTVNLPYAATYTVKVDRVAQVNGNTLEVRNHNGALFTQTATTGFTPTLGHAYVPVSDHWTRLDPTSSTHIMAAAQWAMQRRSGGTTGETFGFRLQECPTSTDACFTNPPAWSTFLSMPTAAALQRC